MNCVELLHSRGPMLATEVSDRLKRPIERVYTELVAAEARGLVRVRSVCVDGQPSHCEWWPAHPEFTPQAA